MSESEFGEREQRAKKRQSMAANAPGKLSKLNADLLEAAWKNDWLQVYRKLDLGADPDTRDRHGNTPLLLVTSENPNGMNIIAELLAGDANPELANSKGITPFIKYARNREIIDMLKKSLNDRAQDSLIKWKANASITSKRAIRKPHVPFEVQRVSGGRRLTLKPPRVS